MQGGARAAFATPSWGPARMTYFLHSKKRFSTENIPLWTFYQQYVIAFSEHILKKRICLEWLWVLTVYED